MDRRASAMWHKIKIFKSSLLTHGSCKELLDEYNGNLSMILCLLCYFILILCTEE